jgi:hypothetical protein
MLTIENGARGLGSLEALAGSARDGARDRFSCEFQRCAIAPWAWPTSREKLPPRPERAAPFARTRPSTSGDPGTPSATHVCPGCAA